MIKTLYSENLLIGQNTFLEDPNFSQLFSLSQSTFGTPSTKISSYQPWDPPRYQNRVNGKFLRPFSAREASKLKFFQQKYLSNTNIPNLR